MESPVKKNLKNWASIFVHERDPVSGKRVCLRHLNKVAQKVSNFEPSGRGGNDDCQYQVFCKR
jgi:hypothetical protein